MDQPAADTPPRNTAAILYHPEGFDASIAQVKGRHSAGAGFLKGLVDHIGVEPFYCYSNSQGAYDDFRRRITAIAGREVEARWLNVGKLAELAEPGCLFAPGPGLADDAWQRRFVGENLYSVCGITHTVSSDRVMEALGQFLTAPVQEWDALICTSQSVRKACLEVIDGYAAYLEERIGARPPLRPQLPVIPLGVDSAAFARGAAEDAAAAELRARLGLGPDDVAGLFLGRLSFHAKAHPVPMFMAFERAQARLKEQAQARLAEQAQDRPGGGRLHLMLVGQFPNAGMERETRAAIARFCPSVTVHVLDGADPALARASWFAADFFISLSDNIQESFGLTPVEAMAAGLPCVVSDWNGYRDTVRHGLDGFRIPTCAPRPGLTEDLVFHHDYGWTAYENYVGAVAQMVSIDLEAASRAILDLVENPGLRRRMGAAGRRRIDEALDWKAVIPRYQAFWGELASRRAAAQAEPPAIAAHLKNPRRLDPLTLFASYPTQALHPADRIVVGSVADWTEAEARLSRNLAAAGQWAMALPAERKAIFDQVAAGGGVRVHQIVQAAPADRRPFVERSLTWMMKFDVLRLARHADVPPEPEAQNDGGGR